MTPFKFSRTPNIHFGVGKFQELAQLIAKIGRNVLIVTGVRSFTSTRNWELLTRSLSGHHIVFFNLQVDGEPSPEMVDQAVADFKQEPIDVVVAIGGGSAVDTGKAISAMLRQNDPVELFLEGVGSRNHDGVKVPFIAVPTTAGTGSEATKNAVLSRVGPDGFKKSLRHDHLVPDHALIDPELMLTCPPEVTAACGMDAFTQLLESFVSPIASPMTDALAWSGLKQIKDCLIPVCTSASQDPKMRTGMAYASFISGVTLANAGLGIVHGLASPIGGYFNIPHGVVCGTLMASAARINIRKLRESGRAGIIALEKYARVGALLTGQDCQAVALCCDLLIQELEKWTTILALPGLSVYGIQSGDIAKIVAGADNKNNPVALNEAEIAELVASRLG